MRVGVVFFAKRNREGMRRLASALSTGIESQGHQVDLIDGYSEQDKRLSMYQYLAVGAEPLSSFSGKIPETIGRLLSASGQVAGRRCFAFVPKSSAFAARALARLMKAMEQEGMYLKYSDVLSTAGQAEAIGRRLEIG